MNNNNEKPARAFDLCYMAANMFRPVGSKAKRIQVDINNDPMIKGNYKVVVRHDVPEDSQDDDSKLLVDIDSIKLNYGDTKQHLV